MLDAGARWVEFDVQLTADLQPVVIHDENLQRLTGSSRRITRLSSVDLENIRVHGPDNGREPIPTLANALSLFDHHPGATALVELKRSSIRRFGRATAVGIVLEKIRHASCPCVFLSFDHRAVDLAREMSAHATGWVFRPWSWRAWWRARRLQPDYLFIRADRVPAGPHPFWPGAWKWVAYGIDSEAEAHSIHARGADLVEVDNLPAMLNREEKLED